MFGWMGKGPTDLTAKWCPLCGRSCEKYILFRHEWYWRCPSCKIDADDPKHAKPKSSHPNNPYLGIYDDDPTQPRAKIARNLDVFASNCVIANKTVTTDANGTQTAELRIYIDFRLVGNPPIESFQE